MPLRTVKTILQQVVSVYGEQVFDALDEIDSAENSFVYQYLYRLASTPAPGRVPQSGRSLSHKASSSSMGSMVREPLRAAPESPVRRNGAMNGEVASPAVGGSKGAEEIEANLRLKEIFDLIGDPVKSRDVRSFAPFRRVGADERFRRGLRRCTSSRRAILNSNLASPAGTFFRRLSRLPY